MNAKERWQAMFLAVRIEYHWWLIRLYRKRGERMIGKGEALDSKRLLRLNRRLNHHGVIAKACEKAYEERYVIRPALRT